MPLIKGHCIMSNRVMSGQTCVKILNISWHVVVHEELGRMPVAYYPHQIVSMNLVGPFPRARFGHSFMFTLIDHLTSWADASPIAHKTVVQ